MGNIQRWWTLNDGYATVRWSNTRYSWVCGPIKSHSCRPRGAHSVWPCDESRWPCCRSSRCIQPRDQLAPPLCTWMVRARTDAAGCRRARRRAPVFPKGTSSQPTCERAAVCVWGGAAGCWSAVRSASSLQTRNRTDADGLRSLFQPRNRMRSRWRAEAGAAQLSVRCTPQN